MVHYEPGCSREILCRCKYFETERIRVKQGLSFDVLDESFQVILCLDGEGGIEGGDRPAVRFKKGDCLFLPAGLGKCILLGETEVLKVRC